MMSETTDSKCTIPNCEICLDAKMLRRIKPKLDAEELEYIRGLFSRYESSVMDAAYHHGEHRKAIIESVMLFAGIHQLIAKGAAL